MTTHYTIRLRDNKDVTVAELQDDIGLVDSALIPRSDAPHGLLRFIDPYGTTTFNGLQSEAICEELIAVRESPLSGEHAALLADLEKLARRAANEVHLQLIFLGD